MSRLVCHQPDGNLEKYLDKKLVTGQRTDSLNSLERISDVWCLIILKDVFTHGHIRDKQLIK